MQRILCVIVVLALASPRAFAQTATPTAPDSAAEAKRLHAEARTWQWTGGALMLGGIVYGILGQTALAQENTFCTAGFVTATCTTVKDPNMAAVYSGTVMVGAGAAMMIVGAMKEKRAKKLAPNLEFGPGRFMISQRIAF